MVEHQLPKLRVAGSSPGTKSEQQRKYDYQEPGRKINYIAQGTDFTIYVSAELTEVAWQRKMFIPQTDVWDLSIDKSRQNARH